MAPTVSVEQRRRALVRRHRLAGDAGGAEDVTSSLLALHATDPATVYLSVLARSESASIADVSAAMYERRSLVRWMAMRRTLFLFLRDDIAMVQPAVSAPLAIMLRKRLVSRLIRNGSDPEISGDIGRWLARVERRVERALDHRADATGAELGRDVPELRTAIPPRTASETRQTVTSSLLMVMSAEARIVRGSPTGAWTSRQHRWEPADRWWPNGLPQVSEADAQRELVRRYLARFGPATADDVQWWTGWNKTTTRRAIDGLPVREVDLHDEPGLLLDTDTDTDDMHGPLEPVAALLPALDATPMGWKHRDWFLGVDPRRIFDRAGNIGPTVWWDGEIVGSWAVAASGEVRTKVVADRGAAARDAVAHRAAQLHGRLGGVVVTPAARTPLERSLVAVG